MNSVTPLVQKQSKNRHVGVVTGGGDGVGKAIAEHLLADDIAVVVVELDGAKAAWLSDSVEAHRACTVVGNAADDSVAVQAVSAAKELGTLTGWVNNAAVFRDAWLHESGGSAAAELIQLNLQPCLAGSAAAVSAFRESGVAGSIVNVSSHQAIRPVRGALPYSTAKAAIEGLTRALAVDYGPWNIRSNAVSLGSIVTERLEHFMASQPEDQRLRVDQQMQDLHPLGRAGRSSEVADVVSFLLSKESSFINGAVIPVDGGRSVHGPDPEAQSSTSTRH